MASREPHLAEFQAVDLARLAHAAQFVTAEGCRATLVAHRTREFRRDKHIPAQGLAQGLDARCFVDCRPDHREIESVDGVNIAVQHLANMQSQVDRGGRFAGLAPLGVWSVDGVHRLGRCVERLATDLFPGCVVERKDRQHTIAKKLQHLTAARAQRTGQWLDDLVEQFDD